MFTTASIRFQRSGSPRRGVSMIEVQVAFVMFGIALSGLAPCMVLYTKHLRALEDRLDPQTTYYLVPASGLWVRKLGVAATITDGSSTGQSAAGQGAPDKNVVEVLSVQKSTSDEQITAQVSVTPIP